MVMMVVGVMMRMIMMIGCEAYLPLIWAFLMGWGLT